MKYFVERVNADSKNKTLFYEIKDYILTIFPSAKIYPNYKTKYALKAQRRKYEFIFKYTKKTISLCIKKTGKQKSISFSKGYDLIVETINNFLGTRIARKKETGKTTSNVSYVENGDSEVLEIIKSKGCYEYYVRIRTFILSRYKKVRFSEDGSKTITFYVSRRKYPKLRISVLKRGIYATITKYSNGYTKKYKLSLNKANVEKIIEHINEMYTINSYAFAKKSGKKRSSSYSSQTKRRITYSGKTNLNKSVDELPDDIFEIEG